MARGAIAVDTALQLAATGGIVAGRGVMTMLVMPDMPCGRIALVLAILGHRAPTHLQGKKDEKKNGD